MSQVSSAIMPRRVSFISTLIGGPWGGSEELWGAAAHAALAQGWAVQASVTRYRPRGAKLDALAAAGARIDERPYRRRPIANLIDRAVPPFRQVARFRPDIVCISHGFPYDFCVRQVPHEIERLTKNFAIPYVVICQFNQEDLFVSGKYFQTARTLYGRAAAVVFVAEHNHRLTERQLAMRLPQGVVLRNPVNLPDTSILPWTGDDSVLRMATVARLSVGTKGFDLLFRALGTPAWQSRAWRLELCGTGNDDSYLRELAGFFGILDRVVFRGHVSDIRSVWAANDVLVLASRGEGTPLALVEAMLCGRPAVVTDVGGNAEWVREGVEGFIADAPTFKSISAALEKLWQARSRLPDMGRAAAEAAAALHDPSAGKTLLNLLGELTSAGHGRSNAPQ